MTASQKEKIAKLRSRGVGYGKIALVLGISQNTVKSYCRRNNIGADSVSPVAMDEPLETGTSFCECCGKEIHQTQEKALLLRCLPEQVVEFPSRPRKTEGCV